MEVRINNYPVEILLENEKTVRDVINSLAEWINQKNLILAGVEIDGKEYSLEDAPLTDIEEIKVLNCLVQSRADVVYDTVNEAIVYCDRVVDFLSNLEDNAMDDDELEDIVSGIEWLQEVFESVSHLLKMDPAEIKFRDKNVAQYLKKLDELKHRILTFLSEMEDTGEIDIEEDLFTDLKEILAMFLVSEEMKRLVIESIDSPDVLINSLKEILKNLPEQKNILEKAAVSYQTGHDNQGMEELFRFIDFMFFYTRTCYQVAPVFDINLADIIIDGISLEEKNRDLQTMLNETMDIIESNDMISLADILEYEIMELVGNLDEYIEQLLNKITG
ncbi:MAG TPA: hypothetical protein PKX79_01200 [Spirochaetota bacterium]|jgi:hypothetical protein|nr:hypothetical protein [Spirochaetota bacterium]HOK91347.1 hypothetical protein [Spirochaetota bacterium]HON15571.1 hypothetical protein [Spirochaetota bacterium]HPP93978.1 hypothetical protein [Spirochaetota bacterium]HRS61698.1 hypothetical protein [Spirochaetota bacterium]